MNLQIQQIPLRGTSLAESLSELDPAVTSLYRAGSPDHERNYRQSLDRVREAYPTAHWTRLQDSFRHPRLGTLVDQHGVVVTTGQQAGLFTGPLITLYKALTAARLAAQLEDRLTVPVIPLFWIASEDHDWQEVNHLHVIDLENRLRRIEASGQHDDADAQPPVARIELDQSIESALADLAQLTPDTEFKDDVMATLRSHYQPGANWAVAFERTLAALLAEFGFLVVQAGDPFVKDASRWLLRSDWERAGETYERLRNVGSEIEAAGHTLQVPVSEGETHLFLEGELGRDRVLRVGDVARLRRSGEELPGEEFLRVLEQETERVSPGVLLRPVAEATAFPVIASVVGPGEIAYLAQTQGLFDLHGLPAPVVAPRASIRLVEARVTKVLEKYELEAEDLGGDTGALIKRLIKSRTPTEVSDALQRLRREVAGALDHLEDVVVERDPGARSAIGSGKQAIFQSIESLESKLDARLGEEHRVLEEQVEKAAVHLYPDGTPQERLLNAYPYLIRYGQGLLREVFEVIRTPLD